MCTDEPRQIDIVERFGALFDQRGVPRMAGRILGRLILADPPYMSAAELAESLQASKGSISSNTHLLIQMGIIQTESLPYERKRYYRVKHDTWEHMLDEQVEHLKSSRKLLEDVLDLLAEQAEQRPQIERIVDFHLYLEEEMPRLVENWRKRLNAKK